jgi:hypothetical protein
LVPTDNNQSLYSYFLSQISKIELSSDHQKVILILNLITTRIAMKAAADHGRLALQEKLEKE